MSYTKILSQYAWSVFTAKLEARRWWNKTVKILRRKDLNWKSILSQIKNQV